MQNTPNNFVLGRKKAGTTIFIDILFNRNKNQGNNTFKICTINPFIELKLMLRPVIIKYGFNQEVVQLQDIDL